MKHCRIYNKPCEYATEYGYCYLTVCKCELACNGIGCAPEKKTIKINLNETVKVRLTDFGRAIYRQSCDRLNAIIGKELVRPDQLKEDEDGYVKFQLWDFMRQYGAYMSMGFPNVIEPLEIIWERRTDGVDS